MLRGLAQYRVLHRLAGAGQAEVYLALDTRLSRRVCIKLYHLQGQLSGRRRAVAEAWQLTRVDSPRTLDVYDVVASGGHLALVTRYVHGCSLAVLMEQPLAPANALAIASDLAAALAALRRAQTVHGDLKAANVLIDAQGRAVLADFGISVLSGERAQAYSRDALSPEQSRDEPVTLASDFFALGLLLYQMLFGEHPFYLNGELELRRLRRGVRDIPACPQLSPAASESIQGLLMSLLAVDPRERPAGTFELREQLREIRSLLPAPELLAARVLALAKRSGASGAVPALPKRLIKLPYYQQVFAWLGSYWVAGSPGARGLLALAMLVPLTLPILWIASPGPCIAVPLPVVSEFPGRGGSLPDEQRLREGLTAMLKASAGNALVLGAGPASDSSHTLSAAGMQDICVAERELALAVECVDQQCLLRMRGRRQDERQERQMFVPKDLGLRELQQALSQLVDELRDFLLE